MIIKQLLDTATKKIPFSSVLNKNKFNSLTNLLRKTQKEKMAKDIFYNILSLLVLSIGGALLFFLMAIYYTPETLGAFKQVLAVLTIVSQISVFGIHNSVLKHVAQYSNHPIKIKQIITNGLVIVLIISTIIALITCILTFFFGSFLFKSQLVLTGLYYIIPAIKFFSINKVLIWGLNGQRKMREYAIFQSLRYILMLVYFIILLIIKAPSYAIVSLLTATECTLSICLLIYYFKNNMLIFPNTLFVKQHLKFGSKIILGGMVSEFNTKLDVLLLGAFTNDYLVGIYSFALIFADGFYQLYVVFRRNYNPVLTQIFYENNTNELIYIKRKLLKYIIPSMSFVAFCCISFYPIITKYIVQSYYFKGFVPLIILLIGMLINSIYIVLGNILQQTGYPMQETILNIITISINLILNCLLIPHYGIFGAALATGISYITNGLLLKIFIKKTFCLDI